MKRAELLGIEARNYDKEAEKKPIRDRDWWWKWIVDYKRKLTVNSLENRLGVAKDSQEFSLLLTNEGMATILSHTETNKYNKMIAEQNASLEFPLNLIANSTPYSDWPSFVQKDVELRLKEQPYLEQIKEKNWSLLQLSRVYIDTITSLRGFESRYWMPRLESSGEIIERSVAIGAYLLKILLEQLGWGDTIDTLITTSAMLPADLSIQIVEFARKKGILANRPKIELRDFRLACSSPSVTLAHASSDPAINKYEKNILLALEVFGDVMGLEQYKDALSFDTDIVPQFGNGFSAFGFDASRMQLEGVKGIFTPDDTQFIRYYEVKPNNKKLRDRLLPWISDETDIIKAFSLGNRIHFPGDKRHIAYVLDNKLPNSNVPVQPGIKFNHYLLIATMFPGVLEAVKQQFIDSNRSDELFKESIVVSNLAAEGMWLALRKKINKHLPRKPVHTQIDRSKANTSSASMIDELGEALKSLSLMNDKHDGNTDEEKIKKDLLVIAASTGLGASVVIALITFLIHKRRDS